MNVDYLALFSYDYERKTSETKIATQNVSTIYLDNNNNRFLSVVGDTENEPNEDIDRSQFLRA